MQSKIVPFKKIIMTLYDLQTTMQDQINDTLYIPRNHATFI